MKVNFRPRLAPCEQSLLPFLCTLPTVVLVRPERSLISVREFEASACFSCLSSHLVCSEGSGTDDGIPPLPWSEDSEYKARQPCAAALRRLFFVARRCLLVGNTHPPSCLIFCLILYRPPSPIFLPLFPASLPFCPLLCAYLIFCLILYLSPSPIILPSISPFPSSLSFPTVTPGLVYLGSPLFLKCLYHQMSFRWPCTRLFLDALFSSLPFPFPVVVWPHINLSYTPLLACGLVTQVLTDRGKFRTQTSSLAP